jgi:pimeloyl-ACP methyl ester carboxylesterase
MGAVQTASSNSTGRTPPASIRSSGSVQVAGRSIFYEASGLAEAGPTVLFLHESGGSSQTFHAQLVGVAQAARCLAPDLPGHGRSEGLGCRSIAHYREEILAFLDALAIRWPVVLAGVCLGSAIAIDLAAHAPHRVAGLVLSGLARSGRADAQVRSAAARGEAPDAFIIDLFGKGVPQRLLDARLKRWRLTSPTVRHGDLTALSEYDMVEGLGRIPHPTLVAMGEEDRLFSATDIEAITSHAAYARLVTIPRAGCLAAMERPGAYNEAVTLFLRQLQSPGPALPKAKHRGAYRRF